MTKSQSSFQLNFTRDLTAGLVVFLVALPLCLGIALASNAPAFSGMVAGIVGGIVVGFLSGSQTSITGPAAGLTAVVIAEIALLGSFEAFLFAVVIAGIIQILLGAIRAGFLAAFFPSSVVKGLLAAIGVILILKQFPHVVGHDIDPEDNMSFQQPNHQNTFSTLFDVFDESHRGAAVIGLVSIGLLVLWSRSKRLNQFFIPSPLVVVLLGLGLTQLFQWLGGSWAIGPTHLVQVPTAGTPAGLLDFLKTPDFSQWQNPNIYTAGFTIAAVASLETLLNLEALDKLDPLRRHSPPNRELVAQGVGNIVCGLVGGLPVTAVIARSSVNINAGVRSKYANVFQGLLLLICVVGLPSILNQIPIACLAAILLVTGVRLASPQLFRNMWQEGPYQFIPFAATLLGIVLTEPLTGIIIGLAVSSGFILWSNMKRPLRRIMEKHHTGDVLRIELANQVSFLNRAALERVFNEVAPGSRVLLDARASDFIDPDVLALIRDFKEQVGPARGIEVSVLGFRAQYQLLDQIQYVDYSSRDVQSALTPEQVLDLLKAGHQRFRTGHQLTRDFARQVNATAAGQHPLAVVLSCIDSRSPAELIFDVGVGDIFNVRIAGNITSQKILGSVEYACVVAGAKLILILGHTRCGAVNAAVRYFSTPDSEVARATGCAHLVHVVDDIKPSIDIQECQRLPTLSEQEQEDFVNAVARRNVYRSVGLVLEESKALRDLVQTGRIAIVGALYDVVSAELEFLTDTQGNIGNSASRPAVGS